MKDKNLLDEVLRSLQNSRVNMVKESSLDKHIEAIVLDSSLINSFRSNMIDMGHTSKHNLLFVMLSINLGYRLRNKELEDTA